MFAALANMFNYSTVERLVHTSYWKQGTQTGSGTRVFFRGKAVLYSLLCVPGSSHAETGKSSFPNYCYMYTS